MTTIDTREVQQRRRVRFRELDAVLADAGRMERAETRTTSGNWTAAQNVQHIAETVDRSIDGFEKLAPEEIRRQAIPRLNGMLKDGFPAGILIPPDMQEGLPASTVTWEEALENLRRAVARTRTETMNADHPFLGPMSHKQWGQFHCRHAELHFSFVHLADK